MARVAPADSVWREAAVVLLVTGSTERSERLASTFADYGAEFEFTSVSSLNAARWSLCAREPALVLADLHLPDGRAQDLFPTESGSLTFAMVILASAADEPSFPKLLKRGAVDCVVCSEASLAAMPRIAARALRQWKQLVRRRRAEATLRAERERHGRILAALPVLAVGLMPDGTIRFANAACERISGRSANELVGLKWSQVLVSQESHAQAEHFIAELSQGCPVTNCEMTLVGLDGTSRIVSWCGVSARNRRGRAHEIIAAGTDVTDHKRVEEINRLQGSALQAVANCVLITDEEGSIIWANPSFTRLTGYPTEEVIGRNPRFLKSDLHDVDFYRVLWETILSGRVWEGQVTNRRKDGTLYEEQMTITPVAGEAGAPGYFIAVKQDITEQSKAARSLGEYAAAMEAANQDLAETTRIAEQARLEAERASKVKSEFLAKMSHELRTPLNSIIGFTELMIGDSVDPPSPKRAIRLEKVHRNARHLLVLINNILDLAKIEAEHLVLEWAWFDLPSLMHECIESTRPLVCLESVELADSVGASLATSPAWYGDEIRVRQLLINLLGNAAKFTVRGRIELRVAIADGHLVMEVEDTGIGIAEADLPRIFLDFEQVDSSSTRRAGGTGLGLAICERLCRLMGGTISARSAVGVGTCFTLRLPRVSPAPSDAPAGCLSVTP